MPTRTVKLYGKVWGNPATPATITVDFDGQQRYQGSVTTVPGIVDRRINFADEIVMATWEVGLDVVGPKALSFSVTGGDAVFHTMHANYMGARVISYKFVPEATWPSYQPSSATEVYIDSQRLNNTDFQTQYGLTKAVALAQIEPDQTQTTEQHYNDLSGTSTFESDGHDNVQIDGVPQVRNPTESELGKWVYPVLDGQTLTCTVKVVPAIV